MSDSGHQSGRDFAVHKNLQQQVFGSGPSGKLMGIALHWSPTIRGLSMKRSHFQRFPVCQDRQKWQLSSAEIEKAEVLFGYNFAASDES